MVQQLMKPSEMLSTPLSMMPCNWYAEGLMQAVWAFVHLPSRVKVGGVESGGVGWGWADWATVG